MKFVKNFTPLFLPNFNSPGDKNTKKMIENGDFYTASKNFTLLPAMTNLTSAVYGVTWVTKASLIEKKPEKKCRWGKFGNILMALTIQRYI